MKVTFRDGGLWILPESKEEHTALGVVFHGLGGVRGARPNGGNWTVIVPDRFNKVEPEQTVQQEPT
jgi:hypothetical protein